MKNKIKQFIKQNDITEMESGTEEWLELIAYVIGFEGDIEDLLDEDIDFDADKAYEILEELGVEVL
jgi:hypothetical protein